MRLGGFVLVGLLVVIGAYRIWTGPSEVESATKVAMPVEPAEEEIILPRFMLPDPESPEFVPDPPEPAQQAGSK